jgi:Cephalosporin hydroxylase
VQKCPLDLWIYQELLHELEPDLIVETGTAESGSALFLASICDLVDKGGSSRSTSPRPRGLRTRASVTCSARPPIPPSSRQSKRKRSVPTPCPSCFFDCVL